MKVMSEISSRDAIEFLFPRHYSGRIPQVSKAFGWYSDESMSPSCLMAVCTFGKPASNQLCKGICGEEYSDRVYELNRLCRVDSLKEPLSKFVAYCLRELKKLNWIVVSYSDTEMNHHGYIYQACNFIYTGVTKCRTDKYVSNGKHSRHYDNSNQGKYRKIRSPKHRYVYFCTSNKKLKREWMRSLRYSIQQYPKGDNNEDYVLGDFIRENIIVIDSNAKITEDVKLW